MILVGQTVRMIVRLSSMEEDEEPPGINLT